MSILKVILLINKGIRDGLWGGWFSIKGEKTKIRFLKKDFHRLLKTQIYTD